jgi:hypothetical protein
MDEPEELEPPLSELLDDPLTRMLMARDGVERDALERLLAAKRAELFGTQGARQP